jgi:hypothetical protein
VARGDVVEDQLVRAVVLIPSGLFDGIAGVHVVEELHALHDATAVNVEARNDSLGEHGYAKPPFGPLGKRRCKQRKASTVVAATSTECRQP